MSLDFEITSGTVPGAVKAVLYGIEGVGKTTFAAQWPGAVFIDVEGGSTRYDVRRLPTPRDWKMLIAEVATVARNPEEVGTLVIDTADAAEELAVAYVLDKHNKSSMEDWAYQAGWRYVYEEFRGLVDGLDACVDAGVNVLVVAHATIVKFEQPDELGAYDRYELKLHKGKNTNDAALLKEWADLLLFANFKTDVMHDEKSGKAHATGGTKRYMYTQRRASYDAKNRFGLEPKLPFDFGEIEGALFGGDVTPKGPKPEPAPEPAAKAPQEPNEGATEAVPESVMGVKFEDVTPENVKALHRLMERDGVTEVYLAQAVADNPKNKYTEADRIRDYSPKFIDSMIAHWDSVAAKAHEHDPYSQDYIPFS